VADLKSLIRLRRWQLDEKRRALSELQAFADRLSAERERLDMELATEAAVAAETFEGQRAYPAYARAAKQRRDQLEKAIEEVQGRIARATDELRQFFREAKTLELAQADRQRRAKEAVQKREAAMLDEIALDGFRRRNNEE
jgi:flagellar protein FliJ